MQKWEYLWMHWAKSDSNNVETNYHNKKYKGFTECEGLLAELGTQGWELVSTSTSFTDTGSFVLLQLFFKRPKQ